MPARLIVDGNNVMGSRPDGWWRDRAGAARRLVGGLGEWADAAGGRRSWCSTGGDAGRLGAAARRGAVRAARRAGAADDVIAALVADDRGPGVAPGRHLRRASSPERVRAHGAT